jgi:putative ABC transport system substrate-binding protein
MTVTIGRRELLAALGAAAAWPLAARGQQPAMLRVGFVGIQPREAPVYTNFLKRLAELGYQEGRNFTFDYIQTPDVEGYERNYRKLAARKLDVFLAVGNERALRAALWLRKASQSCCWPSISTLWRGGTWRVSRVPGAV